MWQCEVRDVLSQQELEIALEDKPSDMEDKEWQKINRQACSTLRLCLAKDQKYSVMRETFAKELWQKLEENYDYFTHTLINGKTEVKYDVVSTALMNNEYRKKDSSSNALTNKQNGASQDGSKASGKSKQVEFDVVPVKSDGDYTNEEETPVDVILVELEDDDTDKEETPAQEPPQEQADFIAASRSKRNIRKRQRFTDMVAYALPMVEESVPTTYKEDKRHLENADMLTKILTENAEGTGKALVRVAMPSEALASSGNGSSSVAKSAGVIDAFHIVSASIVAAICSSLAGFQVQIPIVEAATAGIHATVIGKDTVEEEAARQTCASTLGKPEAFLSFSTYIMLDVVGRIPAPQVDTSNICDRASSDLRRSVESDFERATNLAEDQAITRWATGRNRARFLVRLAAVQPEWRFWLCHLRRAEDQRRRPKESRSRVAEKRSVLIAGGPSQIANRRRDKNPGFCCIVVATAALPVTVEGGYCRRRNPMLLCHAVPKEKNPSAVFPLCPLSLFYQKQNKTKKNPFYVLFKKPLNW
ncbi:hypothetical protein MRB53_026066 [Persea americana]|uniref:Uncharacterized protein n=1 Tax=Persea americana TaxID=3435 RepID=A0ACC2LGY6_PERAE|nr:hypothetical protein MRB53_026066 [Persea americana]